MDPASSSEKTSKDSDSGSDFWIPGAKSVDTWSKSFSTVSIKNDS
jgi:hypothetical protein